MDNESVNTLARVPYDNYKIFHPSGALMCYCSRKKAMWYVRRDLAELVNGYDVHLTFTPKGYGDPVEILVGRHNMCVVSGEMTNLTRHHVVPTQYRQHFERKYKDKNSCDLVVLSRSEHNRYENAANDFKNMLHDDHIDDDYREVDAAWGEAKSLWNCIDKHYDRLPPDRQVYMRLRLEGVLERWHFTDDELRSDSLRGPKDYNRAIVESVGTVNLIVLWKLHFLKHGGPKFLPGWWKPNLIKVINKIDVDGKTDLVVVDVENNAELLNMIKKYDLYETHASLHI
jgi:hypothetical protein